jgi:hypothetical protein
LRGYDVIVLLQRYGRDRGLVVLFQQHGRDGNFVERDDDDRNELEHEQQLWE